ncbi:hypothetical protein [Chitinimonas taiwanensis]|uniref:hypothetical protein n=1 Tax=Chitinimonas taiwanensis TaxID=240412 RepID=UPI0035B18D64
MSVLKLIALLLAVLVGWLVLQRLLDPRAARRQRLFGLLLLLVLIAAALIWWQGIDIHVF